MSSSIMTECTRDRVARKGAVDQTEPIYPLKGESSARICSCADRIRCKICRRKWITRSAKNTLKRLYSGLPTHHSGYFATFTIRTTSDWQSDLRQLHQYWQSIGRRRTNDLRCKPKNSMGLDEIIRGMSASHIYSAKSKGYGAHLHGVLLATPYFVPADLGRYWRETTGGHAHIEPLQARAAAVKYAIGGDLPPDTAGLDIVARYHRGLHVIRHVGS